VAPDASLSTVSSAHLYAHLAELKISWAVPTARSELAAALSRSAGPSSKPIYDSGFEYLVSIGRLARYWSVGPNVLAELHCGGCVRIRTEPIA
jgi:hypothetical protein